MAVRKVVIVGGGMAGLSAAYELSASEGFEVHLLEERNRLGGRVHACTVNGQGVDMGGFLIYPWYKRYYQLIEELKLTQELTKVPDVADYYAPNEKLQHEYDKGFDFSFEELIRILMGMFPSPLMDTDPAEPDLHAYSDMTIQDYVKSLNLDAGKTELYLRAFDTYLQGYCYGPVSEHKMAFMASTLYQNLFKGDVHSASYFKSGSAVFIEAMQQELEKRGVQIHLSCKLLSKEGSKLVTTKGGMQADDLVLCHHPSQVQYTKFITVTIACNGIATVEEDTGWGSCFYKEDAKKLYPVLSVVNLEKLYGKHTAGHFNLNIKVNAQANISISSAELLPVIQNEMQQKFKNVTVTEIVNRVDWDRAMPLAGESFVDRIRNEQGLDNTYFGSDFMGCPGMETAMRTGQRAAEKLIAERKM